MGGFLEMDDDLEVDDRISRRYEEFSLVIYIYNRYIYIYIHRYIYIYIGIYIYIHYEPHVSVTVKYMEQLWKKIGGSINGGTPN